MSQRSSGHAFVGSLLAASVVLSGSFLSGPRDAAAQQAGRRPDTAAAARPVISKATLRAALRVIGLSYTDAELDTLLAERGRFGGYFAGRGDRRNAYDAIRSVPLSNADRPALYFRPLSPARPIPDRAPVFAPVPSDVKRPARLEDVAFWPIPKLAALLRSGQVTSVELTRMYLDRLRRYDPQLHAVVTLTDSLALRQARAADSAFARGRVKSVLQGIPFGVKDLYAVPGYPTTWGARPYEHRVLDETATPVKKLENAGAVLVAKLTSGALAMGDVWFGGMTRNPWNTEEGSSGSSAGPAAAVSAGLVPFALGTETLGSIISPSTRTGITGLRPGFGRVSKHGVMALSWSMDKVGPLCRDASDCALVFDAIRGADPADPSSVDAPFPYRAGTPLSGLRIGYLASAFGGDRKGADLDRAVLEVLKARGATLVPLQLPDLPVNALRIILDAEAGAAFDTLTRSGLDSLLVRQTSGSWPNIFRAGHFIPAVEYIQANRVRRLLQERMRRLLDGFDVYVSPAFAGGNLLVTNLTGHPCVAVPDGFTDGGEPSSITFCGPMYGEAGVLEAAAAYQAATPWDEAHPKAFGGRGRPN